MHAKLNCFSELKNYESLADLEFLPEFEWLYEAYIDYSLVMGTTADNLKPIEERELEYRDGAYGITELLGCPIKAKLRREHRDKEQLLRVKSLAIAEGFRFENTVKRLFVNKYGKVRAIPEYLLNHDSKHKIELPNGQQIEVEFKLDGHLDLLIKRTSEQNKNKQLIVGIELKHTIVQHAPNLDKRVEGVIIVPPEEIAEFDVNPKYVEQAMIQRYILEQHFPEAIVEQYLLINTTLLGKYHQSKVFLVVPILEGISKEEFDKLVQDFLTKPYPRATWECNYCVYKDKGLCKGLDSSQIELLLQSNGEHNKSTSDLLNSEHEYKQKALEYIARKKELEQELKTLDKFLRKFINRPFTHNGKTYGWTEYTFALYDVNKIMSYLRMLEEKGIEINYAELFEVKRGASRKLEQLLGKTNFDLCKTFVKRKRFNV